MRYKNLMIIFTALCFCGNADAGNNPVKLVWYEVDGARTYMVSGCVPGSQIAYYSEATGGDVLKTATVDAQGHSISVANGDFAPAFVLDENSSGDNGVAGNRMVSFVGEKEFALRNTEIHAQGNSISLNWNAAVPHPDAYHFEILKSTNGADFSVIGTENAASASEWLYSFTDQTGSSDTRYELRITNGNGITFTSQPLATAGSGVVTVFPTVAGNVINVRLNGNIKNSEYGIINSKGQIVRSGTLNQMQTSLSIDNLSPGNYIIQVTNNGKIANVKFVKG